MIVCLFMKWLNYSEISADMSHCIEVIQFVSLIINSLYSDYFFVMLLLSSYYAVANKNNNSIAGIFRFTEDLW